MVGWLVRPPCRFLSIHISWSAVLSFAVLLGEMPESSAQPAGPEFLVNTHTVSFQKLPAVAAAGNGDFVVAWESHGQDGNPLHPGVFGQRFASSGGALGSEFQVNTATLLNQDNPKLAAEPDGDFVAVYDSLGGDGSARAVFARRFTSTGNALGTEFQVNSFTPTEQNSADVATDAAGNFVVAWGSTSQDQNGYGVFARRYASTGAAVGSEFQVNTHTIGSQLRPAVAFDADGRFVVAWESGAHDGSASGIFGQRYASTGSAIGNEFQINTYTLNRQWLADVASDGDGDFVVVWESEQQDGYGGGIFGQRFASDGARIGSEFRVNSYTQQQQLRPSVASESDGDFTVVWGNSLDQDGNGYGVFGQRYASSGAPIGTEFQVNTYTPGHQYMTAVAAQSDEGHFVVVWQGDAPGGADIFGQRYGAISLCPAAPDIGCTTGFAKGLLIVKELAGKEKLIAKLLSGPATAQSAFGDPTTPGGTGYSLCVYDDASNLVAALDVDRAGDATCSGGAKECWKAIGGAPPAGKGYKYKDKDLTADGLLLVLLKGGEAGKVKIVVKGFGASLPLPIAGSLTTAASVTLQLRASDASQCFSVTLADVKNQEADFFKAK